MIHSKENSQLAHCLCGILVTSKERRKMAMKSVQQKTFDTDCIYEALSHQFQKFI